MYVVMIACEDHCDAYEPERETFRTEDPAEAIHRSSNHRDKSHRSWVEEV